MWFPTNTQNTIMAKMGHIEESFINYYGTKYAEKIHQKFKDFIFIVMHDESLFNEEVFFSNSNNKIICKYMRLFLEKNGIKEPIKDYVLLDLYEKLKIDDVDSVIDILEKALKIKIKKFAFLINYKIHMKDIKKILLDIEDESSKISCVDDFIKIKKVIKKNYIEYLKEIYELLSDGQKKIFDDLIDDNEKLEYFKDYLPNIDFNDTYIEWLYEKNGIDFLNNMLTNNDKIITEKDVDIIKQTRIKYKKALDKYFGETYASFIKQSLISIGINKTVDLDDSMDSSCYIKETEKNKQKVIYSIIKYILPVNDNTIIHEINHHIESYVALNGHGISGWQPIKAKYIDSDNVCSVLLTEIINTLIAEDIVNLMHNNGINIISQESKDESDYLVVRSLIEPFFIEFKDIIIESRIGENPKILFEKLGEDNLKDLNNMFKEIEAHKDYPENVDSDFLKKYQSIADDILQRMIEQQKNKSI